MGFVIILINTVCYTGLYFNNILKRATQSIKVLGWAASQYLHIMTILGAWPQENFKNRFYQIVSGANLV